MANLKHLLLGLHLSEKAATLFLSLIKHGKATATVLGRDTGITRTYVYDIMEGLIAQGLVSEIAERGVKAYEAVDHAGLMAFVSRRQKELIRLEKEALRTASEFNALKAGTTQKTRVRFFDGAEGIHQIYAEIKRDLARATAPSDLITIFSPERVEAALPGWLTSGEYITVSAGMTKREIVSASNLLPHYHNKMKRGHGKHFFKVWPKKLGDFPVDTISWGNKIVYVDVMDSPSGIVIENAAMALTFRMWFERMWGSL